MGSYEEEQARLAVLMAETLDMSDEEVYDSDKDPDYQRSGSSDETDEEPPAKKGIFQDKKGLAVPATSKTCAESTVRRKGPLRAQENSASSENDDASEASESNPVTDNASESEDDDWQAITGDFQNFLFQEDTGVSDEVQNIKNENEFAYFTLFIDDEIMDLLVSQTNLYAEQTIVQGIIDETIGKASRLNQWFPTNKNEMYRFLGILIWMGLDKKPRLTDYWRKSDIYLSNAAKTMSRNRFELLLRMWHFSDNSACPQNDRLYKIQPLVDLLNARFRKFVLPDEHLCIDETMVPFRGRLKFRQYIKGKRHKFGIKLFKLCLRGGYTFHSKIYCGADKTENKSVATKVVMELMHGLLDKGATLYTDNWYTSLELAEELKSRKIHLVGTIRKNRKGLPRKVIAKRLSKGETYGREKDGIVVLKWKDKRDVLMLTTKHTDEVVHVPGRNGARQKPKAIADYNNAKSFIDMSDQMSSYSTSVRRSLKWFRKLAVEIIAGTCIVNAHYLYNNNGTHRISITEFKENLCEQLLSMGRNTEELPVEAPSNIKHVYTKSGKKGRCQLCYKKNKEAYGRKYAVNKTTQVSFQCNACEGKPLLCMTCFIDSHNITAKR